MPSKKPTEAPAFDASTTWKVLDTELKKDDGSSYAVFQDKSFPTWKRWVDATAEFDGKGLKDVVEANALYLDAVKDDLDQHRNLDNTRHSALGARVSALEAQGEPPFPIA